jgi:hypothetical protein
MTRYVFVSHANLDKPTLKWVLEGLLAAGLPLWIDRPEEVGLADHRLVLPGIRPGADWDAEIRRAYEGSACVLFFLPRNSNNPARSDSLFREFDHGSANDKLVIAKLDDIDRDELSGLMRIRQALDLSGMGRDGSAGLKSLVSALRSYVPREAKGSREERPKRKMVEGAVVCTEITGAQASVHTLAKVLVDQMLPIVDGLYPLDPASNIENVDALKDVVRSQLTNLTSEIGFLGGPRVMRVQQYLQMLLGVTLNLSNVGGPPGGTAASVTVSQVSGPPANSPLALANAVLPAKSWSNPDFVLGSLGDLRDSLGLSSVPLKKIGRGRRDVISYINTVEDEQNVTNFRILVEYANSFLDVWVNNVQFFAAQQSQFPGAQLVVISRQLGVISETLDEVRVVLDSVFVGPASVDAGLCRGRGAGRDQKRTQARPARRFQYDDHANLLPGLPTLYVRAVQDGSNCGTKYAQGLGVTLQAGQSTQRSLQYGLSLA